MTRNKRELDIQREICQSVRREGGWAKKLTNRFTIGIPDLLIARFPSIPFIAEVKDLGQVRDTFSRKLDVTEKQSHELRTFDQAISDPHADATNHAAAKRYAAVVLVGWAWGRDRWLAMLPPDADHITMGPDRNHPMVHRQAGGYYPIGSLIQLFGKIHEVRLL